MRKIISPKYDFSFKNLFRNEEVRKYFIRDVLGIPLEEIRQVELRDPNLWKRYRWQKQGILDILIELNDDSRVNIEMQVAMIAYWDKRNLLYLSKMFTEGILTGQDYTKLKRCISISVLDFNLDESPSYHRVYRMRDKDGQEYSDMLEVHVIELNKPLDGNGEVDDWIRLLNAKTEEELAMLEAKTKNPGILEAIKEVRVMSLGRMIKVLYEGRMKQIRDRNARDAYVREEGRSEGIAEGIAEGRTAGIAEGRSEGREITLIQQILRKLAKGRTAEEIAEDLEEPLENVKRILRAIGDSGSKDTLKIYEYLGERK